jgi:hypothetical protein
MSKLVLTAIAPNLDAILSFVKGYDPAATEIIGILETEIVKGGRVHHQFEHGIMDGCDESTYQNGGKWELTAFSVSPEGEGFYLTMDGPGVDKAAALAALEAAQFESWLF